MMDEDEGNLLNIPKKIDSRHTVMFAKGALKNFS